MGAIPIEKLLELEEALEGLTDGVNTLSSEFKESQREKDAEFYRQWLLKNDFIGGKESASASKAEISTDYASISSFIDDLLYSISNRNSALLQSSSKLIFSSEREKEKWKNENYGKLNDERKDNKFLKYKLDENQLKDLIDDLLRYQERRNILGAINGVENERSNVQNQINRTRKYIDLVTNPREGDPDYMETHRYVQNWKNRVNFSEIFHDLEEQATPVLEGMASKLRNFINANAPRLRPEDHSNLLQSLDKLEKEIQKRNPFGSLKEKLQNLDYSLENIRFAQEAYNKAVREGTEAEQQNAKATLDAARNAKQKALAEATDSLHNSVGQVKEYVGAAEDLLGLVEQFGIDPPEWMGEWLEGMGQTLDGLESIDLTRPMSILTGGVKALSGVVKQVFSLGGIINWSGSNAKEVQATMERLTNRNELLQTSIEDLTDTLKQSRGTKSVAAYRDAYKMQQETNMNYLQMAMAQAGYHGSHHSWNYYWGGFSQAQIDKLSGQIGRQWDGNLWSLSPEEMKALRSNVDMWTQIQNTGKGGYGGRLTEKLDDYIAQAGKLEELTDQLYEGLTGISFDGMYSSFIDNLMNMKYGAKDAAEDISEYFMRAMLSNKIGELYSEKLKGWWEKFGKAMEDNELTEAERNALTEEYMQYVDEALALRDNLAAATGYDKTEAGGTSQSAKAGGFTAMTQDQGTKLEGMFTSGLQHWSSMDDRLESVVEKMDTAEGHLARIAENTGVSAGHLGELKEVIKKMIRDGLKVK